MATVPMVSVVLGEAFTGLTAGANSTWCAL